ncbi:unnamed protein product [Pleuronectes platessa]|uniref:Peptidase M12B propeptide domain-containing protein n=1 Tax=Pleuronectes platessa TaxID=8262 RepID=A0A9N7UI96_PLEPL|nr:unnamed protein product [Pleuronectes platessa]
MASSPLAALPGNVRRRLLWVREGPTVPRVLLTADPKRFSSLFPLFPHTADSDIGYPHHLIHAYAPAQSLYCAHSPPRTPRSVSSSSLGRVRDTLRLSRWCDRGEYVKIMRAVWCFMVFAAVGERLAVSGVDRSPAQDGGMWGWFTPAGRPDSGDTAAEITHPKWLVQQTESEEEVAQDFFDTRVKNSTGDTRLWQLSTRDVSRTNTHPTTKPLHLAQTCFRVAAFGHTFTLDLELNHHLLSSEYVERHFNQDGRPAESVSGWRERGEGRETLQSGQIVAQLDGGLTLCLWT